MHEYTCSTCEAPAEVLADGTIKRSCEHTSAVHWNMQAVVYGLGGLKQATTNPVLEMFYKLGRVVLEAARGLRPGQ